MSSTLQSRFETFLREFPGSECLDDGRANLGEKADFLIENRQVVVELKRLDVDPVRKIEAEIDKHRNREEFPLFYGKMDIKKVLRHLPDGGEINRVIVNRIGRSVEDAVRKANSQIQATVARYGLRRPIGLLVLLNDKAAILTPDVVAHRVRQVLQRREDDGSVHYTAISHVWILSERHEVANTLPGWTVYPTVLIERSAFPTSAAHGRILTSIFERWASFNNAQLLSMSGGSQAREAVRPIKREAGPATLRRQDLWRLEYRDNPYLRGLSDEDVLSHGARLLKTVTPYFLKGGPRAPRAQMVDMMRGWTQFIEEALHRGLNLRGMNLPPLDHD